MALDRKYGGKTPEELQQIHESKQRDIEWRRRRDGLDSRQVEEHRHQDGLDRRREDKLQYSGSSLDIALEYDRKYVGKTPEELQQIHESKQRNREWQEHYEQ